MEGGVKYAKNNCLKGRQLRVPDGSERVHLELGSSASPTNGFMARPSSKSSSDSKPNDRRLGDRFPRERFPCFREARRSVYRDGHVEVDKAYYSAPPEYVGRRLWVRWDRRLVRIFNDRWEQLIVHATTEPGRFRTSPNTSRAKKSRPSNAEPTRCCGRSRRSVLTRGSGPKRRRRFAAWKRCVCWSV